jgi:pyruvate dehydrogenase E1 component alpha subunit
MHRVIGERDIDDTPFSAADARTLFTDMVRARAFDERALALQRRGWMSGYPPFRGQEASQVGAAHAMAEVDWLFPTYRSNAMQIGRGVPMRDILAFRRGLREFHSGHDVRTFPQAVPIATQILHAVGFGMAANYRDTDEAMVAYFGDGATSEGDFHEGMNFAGVFDAPVVFLCENNGWAISMPRERQTASKSIAVKAEAYGFEGGQVDGNDPLAVQEYVADALRSARAGDPFLVESLTYRQGPHTTSDDPSRYEDRADYPEWRTRDPLDRFEEYLREQGVIEADFRGIVREEADAEVSEAVETATAVADPDIDELFDYVYAETTPNLDAQKAWLGEWAAENEVGE